MKNSDMPAMPISEEETDRVEAGIEIYTGLTKREMMAMHMMSGMLSSGTNDSVTIDKIVKTSVIYSDALLAELERTSK